MCWEAETPAAVGRVMQVLVVEDESLIAEDLALTVQEIGAAVVGIAASAEEAVRLAAQHRPDVVLMDIRLRGVDDGVDAAKAIRAMINPAIIFCTGNGDSTTRQRIRAFGNAQLLLKPVNSDELIQAIGQALSA
jgi:CheY-like chemotaxis protein